MASRVRFGIVGTGGIARAHATGLKAMDDDAEIVSCADVMPGRAKEFAEQFGVKNYYDDAK